MNYAIASRFIAQKTSWCVLSSKTKTKTEIETGNKKAVPSQKQTGYGTLICQLLVLAVGIGWTVMISQNKLDETHIPGFLIALAVSWWLTPEIRARALKLGLVDKPGDERRIHTVAVPRLGGVGIYMSFLLTMCALAAITGRFPQDARIVEGGLGIFVGGTIVFILGLIDDLESLPAKAKLVIQILAACAAYSLGVRIRAIPLPLNMDLDLNLGFLNLGHFGGGIPIELHALSLPITVLWLVGVANAVNLIDGMDGLAAGVSLISALTIWSVSLAVSIDKPYAGLMAAVLAGALLGFLRWNFNPARIFLGDSGAYLVGFILAAISITGVIKGAAAATVIVPTAFLVLLILFFPLLDTSWAIVRRAARGKSVFEPDRQHIHHRLLDTGLSQKKTAYVIYSVSALLGLLATFFVGQQWYFLEVGASVLSMAFFFAFVLNGHRNRRKMTTNEVYGEGSEPEQPPEPVT
jgi:UDP-GlcNAc:undecaprenyl-phosphate GlcNAc-1-phosphate transferase